MPPDSIISYWKPEVSVKLVADFEKYPVDYGKKSDLPHGNNFGADRRDIYMTTLSIDSARGCASEYNHNFFFQSTAKTCCYSLLSPDNVRRRDRTDLG